MQERWKELQRFPGYAISDQGRVMNTNTDLVKNPAKNQQGILMVNLSIRTKQHVRSVAVLIAEEFLDHSEFPSHFDTPIHLNGDKQDCRVENLKLRPRWFAVKYHQQFSEWERENRYGFRTPIILIDTDEIFPNSWEPALKYGLLDREIFLATVNRTYVFPYNYHFCEYESTPDI